MGPGCIKLYDFFKILDNYFIHFNWFFICLSNYIPFTQEVLYVAPSNARQRLYLSFMWLKIKFEN